MSEQDHVATADGETIDVDLSKEPAVEVHADRPRSHYTQMDLGFARRPVPGSLVIQFPAPIGDRYSVPMQFVADQYDMARLLEFPSDTPKESIRSDIGSNPNRQHKLTLFAQECLDWGKVYPWATLIHDDPHVLYRMATFSYFA